MEKEAEEMSERIISTAKSYDEALMIISQYVDITESRNQEDEEEME